MIAPGHSKWLKLGGFFEWQEGAEVILRYIFKYKSVLTS